MAIGTIARERSSLGHREYADWINAAQSKLSTLEVTVENKTDILNDLLDILAVARAADKLIEGELEKKTSLLKQEETDLQQRRLDDTTTTAVLNLFARQF